MEKQFHLYLNKHPGKGKFASLLGVHRNTVRYWLDRENWVANGRKKDSKKGIRIDPRRWSDIVKITNNEITRDHLYLLSSF